MFQPALQQYFPEGLVFFVRFHFAKNDETLIEALNRLEKMKKLKK